jgi:UDP-glucose 4-epimerase
MKVFIFGGAGFIGQALYRELIHDSSLKVSIVDNGLIQPEVTLPSDASLFEVDVTRPVKMKKLLADHRPEIIYWLPAVQGYGPKYSKFGANNVGAVYTLFESIDSVVGYRPHRIILASSQAVYSPGENVSETWPMRPHSIYGYSKIQQEEAMRWFSFERGIDFVALRYSIVLGRGQALQASESGMLRNWYRAFKLNEPPEIYGTGRHVRDFVHITDVTKANVLALTMLCGVYNVAGFASNILSMCGLFRSASGCFEPNILGKDIRPGGEYSLTSDYHRIETEWGWCPTISLRDQVEDFFEFAESKSL